MPDRDARARSAGLKRPPKRYCITEPIPGKHFCWKLQPDGRYRHLGNRYWTSRGAAEKWLRRIIATENRLKAAVARRRAA